jgi:hypothetical protein
LSPDWSIEPGRARVAPGRAGPRRSSWAAGNRCLGRQREISRKPGRTQIEEPSIGSRTESTESEQQKRISAGKIGGNRQSVCNFSDLGENQNSGKGAAHTVTPEKQHHAELVQTQREDGTTHIISKTDFFIKNQTQSQSRRSPPSLSRLIGNKN